MSRKIIQITFSILLLAGMAFGFAIKDGALAQANPTPKLEAGLGNQLKSGPADFIITMAKQADVSAADQMKTKEEKGQYVFDTLVATAANTQKDLLAYLDNQGVDYQSFYIVNAVWVKHGTLNLAETIAARPDVATITINHTYKLEKPINPTSSTAAPQAVEPNISFVKADQVWAMGITGQGTVVADDDTGLDNTHPAIAAHFRGCVDPPTCSTWDYNYNWWDAWGTYATPYDDYGHGTHTAGTMVGDDGAGNQIGMAPGAKLISCKNMVSGNGDDAHFLICFQWDLAPWDSNGANPLPSMAPDAVNNSWGYSGGGQNQFRGAIDNLQAAGILVEVSAGNEGPSCSTLRSPGDYQEVLTTGSVSHIGQTFPGIITLSSWSPSRGPSSLDGNYFPDIMAPGDTIRSSLPGNQYAYWSGTSMAGPHATALIGLIWSANPALRGQVAQTIDIIRETAGPLTGQNGSNCGGDYNVGPNNDWGYGTIDALSAVQLAITMGGSGQLDGTVTDATTTDPLEGVKVAAEWEGGFSWIDTTDAAGLYSMQVPEGNYTVTASLYGYSPSSADAVVVSGTTTVLNFALEPAAFYLVQGKVTDANTGWPLYAKVTIDGYPGAPIWTNPVDGSYSITLPEGILYKFNVQTFVAGYLEENRDVGPLTGPLTEYFELLVDQNSCNAPGYSRDPSGIVQDFETMPPAGWTIVSNIGGGLIWNLDSVYGEGNYTGGAGHAAVVDSNYNEGVPYDTELRTPVFDLSAITNKNLSYLLNFAVYSGNEALDVDISTDSGGTWTNLRHFTTNQGSLYSLPGASDSIDLSAYGAETNVMLRWRYYTPEASPWDWYAQIDEVRLTDCLPQPGGLVVGNVYDNNTDLPLVGALVSSDEGSSFVTVATPEDPNVDDGFYTLFGTPGLHEFTASMANYQPDVEDVSVVDGDTVLQDFSLGAGYLDWNPDSLHATLDFGAITDTQLTLSNLGGAPLTFEISEVNGGFTPANKGGTIEFLPQPVFNPDIAVVHNGPIVDTENRTPYIHHGTAPSALNIIVYADDDQHSPTAVEQALDALALTYTFYGYDGSGANLQAFTADLQGGGWDLAIYAADSWALVDASDYEAMRAQIAGGGMAIAQSWAIGYDSAHQNHALWTAMGVQFGSWLISPESLYWWEPSHPILNGVPEFTSLTNLGYIAYGAKMNLEGSVMAEALGGFTTSPTDFQDGIVLRKDNKTIYKGLTDNLNNADLNGNGILDTAEWWTNAVGYILNPSIDVPWLSEDPISGTIPATPADQIIDVSFDASVVNQPGDYYADLKIKTDAPYGGATVPVTMTVLAPDTWGKLDGTVTDICTGEPIKEVKVEIAGGNPITQTFSDENGYYWAWIEQGTFTVTYSLPDYLAQEASLEIVAGETTTNDVILVPDRPCITVEPKVIEAWVITDTEVYTTGGMQIGDPGAQDLLWEIQEKSGGYMTETLSIPASDGNFPRGSGAPSLLRAPHVNSGGSTATLDFPLAGEPAFAVDVYPGYNLVYIPDTTIPGTWNIVAPEPGNTWYAGDFINGDFSTLYVIDSDTSSLYAVDTTTGATTLIGPSVPGAGESWTGMSGAPDGTMYASASNCGSNSTLYTVDLNTGVVTAVGPITNGPCIIDIAVNAAGDMYGVDIVNDMLIKIDPATGEGTVIGSIGFDANFAQGMDFEEESGVLYLAAYNNSTYQGELRIADTSTGNSVLVGAFPGGAEVDCLAFPTGGIPVDVPWVSEEPVSGTVAAGVTQDVGVMFTAQNPDGTPMPLGTYFATLNVKSNDSVAGTQPVEVIMHIVSEYLAPAPEFTSNTPVNVGDPMEFLNLSDAGIPPTTEYLWNFGDGITQTVGTTDPVIHLYGTYGTFTVSLTACNVVDCVTVTHDVVVLPKVFYLPIINKN